MNNHSISTMTGKTKIKVVFLGGQSVGKSSIIEKYIHDRFDESSNPTVGIDFLAKNISHKAKNYRMQLWDTAGQQRFRSLIPSYLKDAHCALIIFDVTSKASLSEVDMWYSLYNENKVGDGFIFLVGNKIDLDYREIMTQEGQQKGKSLGLQYFEISAKSGQNIEELFLKLIEYSTQKPSTSSVGQKKQTIRQQPIKQQQDNKQIVDETDTKITVQMNACVQVSQNVVLKNQKISNKGQKKKGCC